GHLVVGGGSVAGHGGGGDVTDVVAAVAGQPAERHVDPAVGHGQGAALLLGVAVPVGDVHGPGEADRARVGVQRDQLVVRVGDLGHDEHRVGARVVGRGAGDPQRVDVAAGQLVQRHRRAQRAPPPGGAV